MIEPGRITRIEPAAGIPGGEVVIEDAEPDFANIRRRGLWFGTRRAHLVAANRGRALASVPELPRGGEVVVTIGRGGERNSAGDKVRFKIATKLAEDLHPVSNPAFDPDDGSLYVTRSGGRGDILPVTLFRVDSDGEINEVSGDIANPTAIAFDQTGQMFVTSRMDGTVYRLTPFHEAVAFATSLGIATGLAFDRKGRMYVGDRTGAIYRISGIGEAEAFAQLEPSVSAYHLAFGPDENLYVTGPTGSSFDVVTRIDPSGQPITFFRGLGRPQGMAFDREGNLYVAASYRGRRGIVRLSPDGSEARVAVAGMNVVGVAFGPLGEMVVATNDAVFSLPLGIHGVLLKDAA
ncbi:MAG: gluconolaconase [Pyrinomonadaceae bacterium]